MARSPTASAERVSARFIDVLRRYFVVIFVGNLVWEFAHMPLYTLWNTGTTGEIVFAAVHCTGGDLLIASSALMIALLVCGRGWPDERQAVRRVIALAMALGVGYTLFSEWLNIVVREAWAYSDLMPVVPVLDAGLSPLAQWIVVPGVAFAWALRPRPLDRGR